MSLLVAPAVGLASLLPAALTGVVRARLDRQRHYRHLDSQARRLAEMTVLGPRTGLAVPDFGKHLVAIPSAVEDAVLARLRNEALEFSLSGERSWVPGHKQGGTISYADLIDRHAAAVAFYRSPGLAALISTVVGEPMGPTPIHDQSSCTLLCYLQPRDRIGWHYDHNFYRGRHITILLVLENRRLSDNGPSSSHTEAVLDGRPNSVLDRPGTLIVFEGARVLHRATALADGERRILMAMTMTSDPRNHWWQGLLRRGKDMAYFGPRALWT
jgi:hypothetical protein